jgi:hypothetical protein
LSFKTINNLFLTVCNISWWFIFKVDPSLRCHHHVAVGCVVEVVEELATSIFMDENVVGMG